MRPGEFSGLVAALALAAVYITVVVLADHVRPAAICAVPSVPSTCGGVR